MEGLQKFRAQIGEQRFADEAVRVNALAQMTGLDAAARARITDDATILVEELRAAADPGLMEQFLAEYSLSTQEGIALMTLAEAFLRTPDADTLDALIRDKIGSGDWGSHRGSGSLLVSASTWALMLTGRVLVSDDTYEVEFMETVHDIIRRLGEPVVRTAVEKSMRILGGQFVQGTDISEASRRAAPMEAKGWLYTYDMLGEAARTRADAARYFQSYAKAISALSERAVNDDCQQNPGISVKLSALHPRYEYSQRDRVMAELVPAVLALALQARAANMGFAIDAEEAGRLELTLDVIEAVLSSPALAGWDGFGVAVQAYSKQALDVIDWLHALAEGLDRRIAVRLVKGAYWDFEIKHAQSLGLENYPVYSRKAHTDVSYLAAAAKLFAASDRIYSQFATHNAHTAAALLEMGGSAKAWEFQRLHGMGEAMHDILRGRSEIPCRVYAPVGVHKDLLAYLVRRLLENGANSSFVHGLLDEDVASRDLVADPLVAAAESQGAMHPRIPLPGNIFAPARNNSKGIDLDIPGEAERLDAAMAGFRQHTWKAAPGIGGGGPSIEIYNPALTGDVVGRVIHASAEDARAAVRAAEAAFPAWRARPIAERVAMLEETARLLEANMAELIALASREAGKTRLDGIAEVREAVDFCRYYAAEAARLVGVGGVGPVACISPWNFPLAIFTGQVAAALVAGNTVLAKPAGQTPLMAARAVGLMHQAGVPEDVLILLPGDGGAVGGALTSNPAIKGTAFTGSHATACRIDLAMAEFGDGSAFLIAETGGLNAMIVDSTALPEQAVRDIIASAYQSAGQRCSSLRILAVQEDIAGDLLAMLEGAAAELRLGDPWDQATDVGPVIDKDAKAVIDAHCKRLTDQGRLLFQAPLPQELAAAGTYVAPAAFRLDNLQQLEGEIFGPVLHVITYAAAELDALVDAINGRGYGLTLGIHSRVDTRVTRICRRARAGNIYVNRNQIGAVVGSQPFGGRGLSGTGPKAGGPMYLHRFTGPGANLPTVTSPVTLPGVTGERNVYSLEPRGTFLCLGGGENSNHAMARQCAAALAAGNDVVLIDGDAAKVQMRGENVTIASGDAIALATGDGIDGVAFDGDGEELRRLRMALAALPGARRALVRAGDGAHRFMAEKLIATDTTASGGNATLLAEAV